MKSLFTFIVLSSLFIITAQPVNAQDQASDKYIEMITRVINLTNVSKQNQLAVLTNSTDKVALEKLKNQFANHSVTTTFYSKKQLGTIKEAIVLVYEMELESSELSEKDKLIFTTNIDDLRQSKAAFAIKSVAGSPRVFVSQGYFKDSSITLDKRLVSSSVIIQSK